jgi:hypothetical protein
MNYDNKKYKIWTWKNPLMLHWIINPGLAINELLLGQRIPKVTLIERNSTKTLAEKTIIPCPHCGTMHSGLKWTPQNNTAFQNWFGLYCDNCGKVIPCLTNLTSYILLGLTFPIWYWFKDKWKTKWLENQKMKFSKPLSLTQPDFKWRYVGLRWGLFMYVFMTILFPLIDGEGITQKKILIGIPVWTIAGLLFGLTMKAIGGKKKNETQNE